LLLCLLDSGTNPNLTDKRQYAALDLAEKSQKQGIIVLLKKSEVRENITGTLNDDESDDDFSLKFKSLIFKHFKNLCYHF
jgi:hypothetical protein